MRRKIFSALCAFLLTVPAMHAQWVVTDPGNLAQGIVNSVNEMVETSETAQNAMSTFKEASKIYEQSRKYYDMLKSVNSLVSGRLMLSEISESYVTNYGKMLTDENYTRRELEAIAFGYNNIMKKSSTSVAELKNIINPTGMSMTDKERLDLIERVYREMRHYRTLVNYYTRKNLRVSYLRAREKGETEQVLKLYGENERYW